MTRSQMVIYSTKPLLVALNGVAKHPDYYARSRLKEDGGYLQALTDGCGRAFRQLPAHAIVVPAVTRAAKRIVTYQSLNHSGSRTHDLLACWAQEETLPRSGLRWWETSAACASSLTALALMSAAANPELEAEDVTFIESAYHPWLGALHTLLDSLVDWSEDELANQPSLLERYDSTAELTETMRTLVRRSREAISSLPQANQHAVILAGMTGLYIATPEAHAPRTKCVTDGVLDEMKGLMRPTLLVMKARRRIQHRASR